MFPNTSWALGARTKHTHTFHHMCVCMFSNLISTRVISVFASWNNVTAEAGVVMMYECSYVHTYTVRHAQPSTLTSTVEHMHASPTLIRIFHSRKHASVQSHCADTVCGAVAVYLGRYAEKCHLKISLVQSSPECMIIFQFQTARKPSHRTAASTY